MRLFVLRPGSAGNNSISCLDDSISCFENQFWTPKNEKHLEKEAFSPDVCKYNEIKRLIACPWICQLVIFHQVKLALQLKIVFFGLTIVPRRSHLNFKWEKELSKQEMEFSRISIKKNSYKMFRSFTKKIRTGNGII